MKTVTYVLVAFLALSVSCASTVSVPVHVRLDASRYEVIREDTLTDPFPAKRVVYKERP